MLTRALRSASIVCVAAMSSAAWAAHAPLLIKQPQATSPGPALVSFPVKEVVIDAGRDAVVTFARVSGQGEQAFSTSTVDTAICQVTRQARVLQGQSIGYVGIRGVSPGVTQLAVDGVHLTIRVVAARSPALAANAAPRIVNPASGATIWGEVAVAVEFWSNPADAGASTGPVPLLRLSDGRDLTPVKITSPQQGPVRHALFILDADSVLASSLELRAVVAPGDSGTSAAVEGAPLRVNVLHPESAQVIAGEAETRYDLDRPKRFANQRGGVASDAAASGGKYLVNAGSSPALCFPVEVDQPGFYQVILTARGTLAGTAYPTVGLVIDGADQPVTNGRVASTDWRRFTIGVPVRLEAGNRILTPYFENDFYVERLADRNLDIDRIEVLRLPEGSTIAPVPGSAGMMAPGMMVPNMMSPAMSSSPGAPAVDARMSQQRAGAASSMSSMSSMSTMSSSSAPAAGSMQMMMMRGGSASSAAENTLQHMDSAPLRITFLRPLEGKPLAGELQVEGVCWSEGLARDIHPSSVPRVTLLVNGTSISTQRSAAPRFLVDPALWTPGVNTVQLLARLDSGITASSPIQSLTWSDPSGESAKRSASNQDSYPRRFERFTIHDERWSPAIKDLLKNEKNPTELRAASLNSNGEIALTLPDGFTGHYEVQLESMGQDFQGSPIASARLVADSGEAAIGEATLQSWWAPRYIGTVDLKEEAKQIIIAFTNDKFEEGKGDRNMWLQAVVLRELPTTPDTQSPVVQLLFPPAQEHLRVYRAGAIVAEAADNLGVTTLELIIDGQPTGMTADLTHRTGRALLPLLARSLSVGKHTLAVRPSDAAGNSSTTTPVEFTVLAEAPPQLLPFERAVKLLNTFGFGPDPQELSDVLVMGEHAFLADRLARPIDDPGELPAWSLGTIRFPNTRSEYDIPRSALTHALLTTNSVRARFVFWAQNHFSTWIRKAEADRKWDEHLAFSRLGPAPFADLLLASAQGPAMLRYLDQQESYARKLNENYAREIMELHTLGVHGGYTQQDVTSLARLLTGWTTARQGDGVTGGEMRSAEFRFDPALSDGAPLEVLGIQFTETSPEHRYERACFMLSALAAHPGTARFISTRLVQHYLAVPAPTHIVDALAAVFLESGGDMRQMLTTLAAQPQFWERNAPPRLAHPLQFSLRLSRASGNVNPWNIGDYLQRSGVGLFDRSTPDGYPEEDAAYTDSNALLQRWRLAQDNIWQLSETLPPAIRYGEFPKDAASAATWSQTVIDLIAVRIIGHVLDDVSNEAALNVLAQGKGSKQERVQLVIPFIAQLPDISLR
ncbi:MAG: DUF1800 family protein [Pyrinomonadaceae bacterium]|nr:DUF1800 family protein [Phycisphaerales bacterium]